MEINIEAIAQEIVQTFEMIMDSRTPADDRTKAHEVFENFKETSPYCAKCGFYLIDKNNPPIVRRCGFQLIEEYIKSQWNKLYAEEKTWVKNTILETIASGTRSVADEELQIKDKVSRIVVEIIKREWPQNWKSLMDDLAGLCRIGDTQKELVLLIFSRLAEDIVQFYNLPEKRRKEIYKAFSLHLDQLFTFFFQTLSENCNKYLNNKHLSNADAEVITSCRLIQVTLNTLSTFVEWVPIIHLTTNQSLLSFLCKMLCFLDLRMPAVMCLMNVLERKGKPEDKKELLIFFEENSIFDSVSALDVYDTEHYLFLKTFLPCLLALGTHLCNSMAQFSMELPKNFPRYLQCVLIFTWHPSLVLSHSAHSIWLNILRSPHLSTTEEVQSLMPTLLKFITQKLLRCGYPSKNDDLFCKFSQLQFDSDEDYELFFCQCRADSVTILRYMSKINPKICFSFGSLLLKTLISGQDWKMILQNPDLTMTSVTCWEAMVLYMEAICGTLMKNTESVEVEELANEGLELLNLVRNFTCEDAVILSFSLSCLSSLFFFVKFHPELKLRVFDKIFTNLTCFKKGDTNAKDIMNLKRHASSLLIKLSMNHPDLLLPEFDYLYNKVSSCFNNENLTRFDKCALLESLMILSNSFYDYDKQSNFLKSVLQSIEPIWTSSEIIRGIESPETLISLIGIDKPHDTTSDNNTVNKTASDLMLVINVLKACSKRCIFPSNPDLAQKGNFIHPLSDSLEGPFYRNPSAQYLIPVLDKIFNIIRIIHELYDPSHHQKFDPSYDNILDLSDTDKNILLGNVSNENSRQPKTPSYYLKHYLHNLYDGCLHLLGASVENLGIDFYMIPDLTMILINSILHKFNYAPPMNIKNIIRIFLRPLFLRCPPKMHDAFMVILANLGPFMLQKLNGVWEKFKSKYGTCIGYEDQLTEAEEIIEDQLNRLITREYLAFLVDLLTKQNTHSANDDSMEDDHKDSVANNHSKGLTELGKKILQTESVRVVFVCTAFESLHWLDSISNIKAVQLCELVFNKIMEDNLVQQPLEANYILKSVLHGLQELGEHDTNVALLLTLGLNVYENLRLRFPDMHVMLQSLVDCNQQNIERLHSVLNQNDPKPKNEKQKKEAFKNTINKIIGKNIGQYHKKNVVIKDLQPLISFRKKKNSSLLDFEVNDDIGLCSLFSPNGNNT